MAAKKKINKSAFVRSMSFDASAAQIVALAKKAGIKLTENYVYTIRSAAKRNADKTSRKAAHAVASTSGPLLKTAEGVVRSMRDEERQLAHLILDVGLGRAQLVFDKIRAMQNA